LPHHKSCKKRLKQAERERVRNNAFRTMLRKTVKEARISIDEGKDINLSDIYSEIDKAAGKGVIPSERAARLKSRLTKAAAKESPSASE